MTGLIKAQSATSLVKPFDPGRTGQGGAVPHPVLPRSAVELALDEARAEIQDLHDTIVRMREDGVRAEQAARKEGESAGRNEVTKEADRRLAAIEQALLAARISWDDRLSALDTLAVMIARSALAKLVKDSDDLGDLVARLIAHRVDAMRHESIATIRVSTDDFEDDDALDALSVRTGSGAIEIVTDPALASGDCRFDLQLGHIDLGVRSQWRELDDFLGTLVAEDVAR
ncbi:FliH/SctL family protein [Sphingomonas sp. ERG5]|uniref:FliH/SctL family protein n=1 Tax=Sphingomonas sp. ERG5 TaxID=1381597 RepID=UPI00054B537D|nr:FliH/SctL family protein [Sphingomonas sp. ERG5]